MRVYDKLFAERRYGAIDVTLPLAWSIGGPATNGNGGAASTNGYVKTTTGGRCEARSPVAVRSATSCTDACSVSCFAERWKTVLQGTRGSGLRTTGTEGSEEAG